MKHGLLRQGMDAFGQRGALEQAHRVFCFIGSMDFPANDLAAV
jgi:hypothetical protein